MSGTTRALAAVALSIFAASANAQSHTSGETRPQSADVATRPAVPNTRAKGATAADSASPNAARPGVNVFQKTVEGVRPYDSRGINMFEAPKPDVSNFSGPALDLGAAFTQPFQAISQSNAASPRIVAGKDQNQLIAIGAGLPLASANLVVNAQLTRGIIVSLENYLASRGHEQFYVKGGYLQIDASPIDVAPLHTLMKYTTLKVGMFEDNFGDSHFRRSDAGQAMYNPFVGNYIVDPFTTEAGAEVYFRKGPWLAMGAVTSGEMRGSVATPEKRGWARYGKVGVDKQMSSDLRVRLTGSLYRADRSLNQTVYSGDRPGSRYYEVLVDSVGRDRWSGSIQPGFRNSVTAVEINPFVKFGGLEFFGSIDRGQGRAAGEMENRKLRQDAADLVYRFASDRLYVGGRYNSATLRLQGMTQDVGADRTAFAGGWQISPLILLKGEYVNQKYNDFPTTDRRSGGKFNGFIAEGVVAF
jgi:hypothetical protein